MEIELELNGFAREPYVDSTFILPSLPFEQAVEQSVLETYTAFAKYENIVIIGQGGSVNSIRALALSMNPSVEIHIIDSQDPYLLSTIKDYAKDSCLIVPISKSGNTLSVIENTLYFNGLPMLFITDKSGSLYELAQKLGAPIAPHPPVGGRFIANTLACLLPAYLAGLPTQYIIMGAKACYGLARNMDVRANPALQLAFYLHEAESRGYKDIYMPIYDVRLSGFKEQIMQLLHETYAKQGKGQTVLALAAPECQHHTNQRYFGGPRNMVGVFISAKRYPQDSHIFVPHNVRDIIVDGKPIGKLNGLAHQQALHAELTGVLAHAKKNDFPYIHVALRQVDPYHIGYFAAFWQLVAVYSAVLRGVNPFDQPEVEYSKKVTRELLL